MKARSSSKRWYAQKASSLFLSLCDLETVYILAYVGSGPKLGRQLGALLDTVATLSKEKLASGGNNINGFWWKALMEAMDKERIVDTENRSYECRAYLCPLPLVIERFARYYAPVIVGGIGALYCASNLCQL